MEISTVVFMYSLGVHPKAFLKDFIKVDCVANPLSMESASKVTDL
jgi:hypothetical protein